MLSSLTTTDKIAAAVVGTLIVPYVMPFVGAYYLAPYIPRREYILDSIFPNQRAAWRESFTDPSQQTARVNKFIDDHKDDPSVITLEHPIQKAYDELKNNVKTLIDGKKPPTVLRVAGKITPQEAGSMDLQGSVGVVLGPNGAFFVDKTKTPVHVKELTSDNSVLSQLNTHFSKAELGGTAVPMDDKDLNILKQCCTSPDAKMLLKSEYPLDQKTQAALKKYQQTIEALQKDLSGWQLTYQFNGTSSSAAAIHKNLEEKAKQLKEALNNAQKTLESDLSTSPEKNTIMAKVKDMHGVIDNTVKDKLIELHQDAQLQRDKFALIVDLMKDSHNKKVIEAQLEEIQNKDAEEYNKEIQQQERQQQEQGYTDEIQTCSKKIAELEDKKKQLTEKLETEKSIGVPESLLENNRKDIESLKEQISIENEKKKLAETNLAQFRNTPLPAVTSRQAPIRKGLSSIDLNALFSNNASLRTPTGNSIQLKQGPSGTTYVLTRSWKSYLLGNQNSQADWEALARIMVAQGCPKGVDIQIGNDVPENMKDKEALKAFEAFLRAGVPKELIDVKIERQDPAIKGSYKEETLTWDNYFKHQTSASWYERIRGQAHEKEVHTSLDKPNAMQQPGQSKNKMSFTQLESKYDELRGTSKEVRNTVLEREKEAKAKQAEKDAEAANAENQQPAPGKGGRGMTP